MTYITCSIEECERATHSRGMCKLHYERNRKTGSPHKPARMPAVTTCRVDGCEKLRYQAHWYCGSHWMKMYRYGNPEYQHVAAFADITGQRFGMLLVESRKDGKWLCACDCGQSSIVAVGDLNRGSAASCGDKKHTRLPRVEYGAVHGRLAADRGLARDYACVDCARPALHWSYDHADTDELTSQAPDTLGIAYSLKPEHYSPRCVSCHKLFDMGRINSAHG